MMNLKKFVTATCLLAGVSYGAQAAELSLAYFMGPKHPMNKGIFTPFGEKLSEVSGGALTVKQFAGGALNKVCLLYTSPSPRDGLLSRMPSSA